ncbi:PLP-dependent aspartate aminotransferase family protein [Flavobacteriaceae bacterium]|nr:PLP-dependent aspartate aminotransferase family protein [Flavobacteriaceae bacterium]MDC1493066.1 PLP-dependent aspartate aminotransferase family protein [Flavobacteriaceae bacterium]
MKNIKKGENTICSHEGEVVDTQFSGSVSPIFVSTSYEYINKDISRYPRYFNTPNQEALCKKISALECSESAIIFGSGMAAISTTLLAFLSSGDHILLQKDIYGGTRNLVEAQFHRYGIEYSFTKDLDLKNFESSIKKNTKVIYIETPSNPLLKIVDIQKISSFAKSKNIITIIDNTFATPIIQKPILFGVDIVLHSATKYFGGHSDISAGAVATSKENIDTIWNLAKNFGGNLSDYSVWLLERSMKTLSVRVKAQQKNAKKLAKYLSESSFVNTVYYPGLKSHPNHLLAKKQMKGYGAMISFEFIDKINPSLFLTSLKLIKPSMSLAGIESTMLSPAETSHSLLTEEDRISQGITNKLIRFSVGIENKKDIIMDIEQAIKLSIK